MAQFFRPEKNDGEVNTINESIAEATSQKELLKILNTTYFDCYSSKLTI